MSEHSAPPHDLDAEAAVLGAILFDNMVYDRVREILRPDDFYAMNHQKLFQHMAAMIESGKTADGVTLAERFTIDGNFTGERGSEYLGQLLDAAVFGSEITDYSLMVRDLSIRRALVTMTADVHAAVQTPQDGERPSDWIALAHTRLQEIEDRKMRASAWEASSESSKRAFAELEDRVKNGKPGTVTGLMTGLPDLDKRLGGLRSGNLIIIAGRPGMAKSGTAGNIAASVAGDGKIVGFFSLEMEKREQDVRLMSQMARKTGIGSVEYVSANDGSLGQNELAILRGGREAIPDTLYLDETPALSAPDIAARCRALKRRAGGLDLVVIDYLQIMNLMIDRGENMASAVARTSAALKRLAKEMGIPVIALSQLSRKCEERDNKRPILSDLRDSGAIEQDADIVIFVYRDEYYIERAEPPHGAKDTAAGKKWLDWWMAADAAKGVMELNVAKIRMGKPGRVMAHYEAATDCLVSKKEELENMEGNFA